jgi:divalent metal cation (Fe/Co/Zn/Cd) transporter
VHDLATLHLGPRVIMVALTVTFASKMPLQELRHAIREMTRALKSVDERITFVYVRPQGE